MQHLLIAAGAVEGLLERMKNAERFGDYEKDELISELRDELDGLAVAETRNDDKRIRIVVGTHEADNDVETLLPCIKVSDHRPGSNPNRDGDEILLTVGDWSFSLHQAGWVRESDDKKSQMFMEASGPGTKSYAEWKEQREAAGFTVG